MESTLEIAGDRHCTFADESYRPGDDGLVVLAQADAEAAAEFTEIVRHLIPVGSEVKANRIGKFLRAHPDLARPLEQLLARCEVAVHDLRIYKAEIRNSILVCSTRALILPPAYVEMLEDTIVEPLAAWAAFEDSICQRLTARIRPWHAPAPAADPRVRSGRNQSVMLARSDAGLIDAVRPDIVATVEASVSEMRFLEPGRLAAELALHSLGSDRWFDEGNKPSIDSLTDQRAALHALAVEARTGEWDPTPGFVREIDSRASRGVQLADLAASSALRDYKRHGLGALADRHALVVCNGHRASAA